jgi:hypothetical protein
VVRPGLLRQDALETLVEVFVRQAERETLLATGRDGSSNTEEARATTALKQGDKKNKVRNQKQKEKKKEKKTLCVIPQPSDPVCHMRMSSDMVIASKTPL